MVMVKYKGSNLYVIGGYHKIPAYRLQPQKSLEIKDEDFWNFMTSKTFAYRVQENIICVPRDFPLSKPKQIAKESKNIDNQTESLTSLKSVLRSIEETNDIDFLLKLSESDTREKVKDAIDKKIAFLDAQK